MIGRRIKSTVRVWVARYERYSYRTRLKAALNLSHHSPGAYERIDGDIIRRGYVCLKCFEEWEFKYHFPVYFYRPKVCPASL